MASRCARHELAVGPDGLCVLCRREAPAARMTEASSERHAPVAWLPLVAFALALGVGVAFWRRAEPAPVASPAAAAPSPEPPSEVEGAPRTERSLPEAEEPELPAEPAAPPATALPEARAPSPGTVSAPARQPSAEDLQAALREVRISVYTTAWCPHCTRARAWLRANDIRYTEYDVEASESARRERDRISPRRGVPTVDIDGEVLTGFGERSWSAAIARATQRRLEKRVR